MELSTLAYLIIAILAVIAMVLVLRSRSRPAKRGTAAVTAKPQSAAKTPPATRNPYRATSIVAGPYACDAVRLLADKRFLVADKETPELPLRNCDEPRCTCKYSHHVDRRDDGEDRRAHAGLRTELHKHTADAERRTKRRGRRSSD